MNKFTFELDQDISNDELISVDDLSHERVIIEPTTQPVSFVFIYLLHFKIR